MIIFLATSIHNFGQNLFETIRQKSAPYTACTPLSKNKIYKMKP